MVSTRPLKTNKKKMANANTETFTIATVDRNKRRTCYTLPKVKKPIIDYKKLRWLCDIKGLQTGVNDNSSEDAHETFMKNYRKIIVQPPKKTGFPVYAEKRSYIRRQYCKSNKAPEEVASVTGMSDKSPDKSANVQKLSELQLKQDNISKLRYISRKMCFDRTMQERNQMFLLLKGFPDLTKLIPSLKVLKQLVNMMFLEMYDERNLIVLDHTGLHLVLHGSVVLSQSNGSKETILGVGKCFGTLEKAVDVDKEDFMVITCEPNCEFLKLNVDDYSWMINHIHQKEENERLDLVIACGHYEQWPKQFLLKLATCVNWVTHPVNTVLAMEGSIMEYLGIIKFGECLVLRQVDVLCRLSNKTTTKKTKQVVMGRLKASDSFGELSSLLDEAMTCSIVTATKVKMGIIWKRELKELDDIMLEVIRQSNQPTLGNIIKEEIEEEYVKQELKREWNKLKHSVVMDVINARGIRPGCGKWAK